ncbi:hypothetical protein ACTRLV_00305 [Corynebacterium durum]|uniref:hypothetical protein n=1 Tax=Corynebacterium durum TaxID=61592 RepID=UPI0040438E01
MASIFDSGAAQSLGRAVMHCFSCKTDAANAHSIVATTMPVRHIQAGDQQKLRRYIPCAYRRREQQYR